MHSSPTLSQRQKPLTENLQASGTQLPLFPQMEVTASSNSRLPFPLIGKNQWPTPCGQLIHLFSLPGDSGRALPEAIWQGMLLFERLRQNSMPDGQMLLPGIHMAMLDFTPPSNLNLRDPRYNTIRWF